MERRRQLFCYLMVAPALILVLVLGVYPMIDSLRLSFLQYDLMRIHTEGTPFVGLQNFKTVLEMPGFLQTLQNTIVAVSFVVPAVVALGLIVASAMNQEFRGRGTLRSLVLIPWVTPPVVASAIWMWMLQPERSPINQALRALGIIDVNIRFLTDPRQFGPLSIPLLSVGLVRVWSGLPFVSVMLLAGLQSIPREMYEAADIDGANGFQKFFYITLPQLRSVLIVLFTLLFIGGIGIFDVHYVMTGGGPRNLTNVLSVLAYRQAFTFYRFDLASTITTIILGITGLISIFYVRSLMKTEL
ncbi:MAG: carbohydrate ABC transporter permease [Anaerolineae bacterium]